jgi:hypothetical protein
MTATELPQKNKGCGAWHGARPTRSRTAIEVIAVHVSHRQAYYVRAETPRPGSVTARPAPTHGTSQHLRDWLESSTVVSAIRTRPEHHGRHDPRERVWRYCRGRSATVNGRDRHPP